MSALWVFGGLAAVLMVCGTLLVLCVCYLARDDEGEDGDGWTS